MTNELFIDIVKTAILRMMADYQVGYVTALDSGMKLDDDTDKWLEYMSYCLDNFQPKPEGLDAMIQKLLIERKGA